MEQQEKQKILQHTCQGVPRAQESTIFKLKLILGGSSYSEITVFEDPKEWAMLPSAMYSGNRNCTYNEARRLTSLAWSWDSSADRRSHVVSTGKGPYLSSALRWMPRDEAKLPHSHFRLEDYRR